MQTFFDKLPKPVQTWIEDCKWKLSTKQAGKALENAGIEAAKKLPAPVSCYELTADSRFAAQPSQRMGIIRWTGLPLAITDSADATKQCLTYVTQQQAVAGVCHVLDTDNDVSLGARLRVINNITDLSERFVLAVVFRQDQMKLVCPTMHATFPRRRIWLGAISEMDMSGCDVPAESLPYVREPTDNLRMVYYCEVVRCPENEYDGIICASRLNVHVRGVDSCMGLVAAPPKQSRPGYVKGELNPMLLFKIW